MHKDMNAFKGGCDGLDAFWREHPEIPGPVKLPNIFNDSVMKNAPQTAAAKPADL